jgi:hypothetical protein
MTHAAANGDGVAADAGGGGVGCAEGGGDDATVAGGVGVSALAPVLFQPLLSSPSTPSTSVLVLHHRCHCRPASSIILVPKSTARRPQKNAPVKLRILRYVKFLDLFRFVKRRTLC